MFLVVETWILGTCLCIIGFPSKERISWGLWMPVLLSLLYISSCLEQDLKFYGVREVRAGVLCGVWLMGLCSSRHWLWFWKGWLVSLCETLAEGHLCSCSPCTAWPCGLLIALCCCSYHPVMLCNYYPALTVQGHEGAATSLLPCRQGSPGTLRDLLAHSGSLQYQESNLPKTFFPVCLITLQWCTPESPKKRAS